MNSRLPPPLFLLRASVAASCLVALHGAAAAAAAAVPLAVPGAAVAAPLPAPARPGADPAQAPRCRGAAAAPAHLALQLGKSSMLRLPEPVASRSVGNPAVLQAMLVAPDTLYLLGVDIGSTNMLIQGKSGLCSAIDVEVGMDSAGLQAALAALLPEETEIRVSAAADTLVLSGSVADAAVLARVLELAGAYVRRPSAPLGAAARSEARDGAKGLPEAAPAGAGAGGGALARVVNFLDVAAPQQVLLEVKIAEVSKTLIDQLEVGAVVTGSLGSWGATLVSNFLTGTAGGLFDLRKRNGFLTLEAQKKDGLVRILAEPTVMAISGQEGSFLAGGKIFIPVSQDNNKVTLEEKEYGVGLRFTPTVLSGGRINLKVAPEVSELSREGIGITAAGFNGTAVLPLITTRRAATTVQLFDGQSFAIGGLIKNNQVSNVKGLPLLSEVPVLGALFRSTDFQQDRTELLFIVTPHLVKPLPRQYALPTDNPVAGRAGLFLGRRFGAPQPAAAAAAPALLEQAPAPAPALAPATPAASPPGDSGFELK